jgi:hypothetical protein
MQVSLRLDSELSELEEALLAAHLKRCSACSSFADDLETVTDTLRTAPPVETPMRIQLPHRPARIGVAQAGTAAAAAIVAAVALGGVVGIDSSPARLSAFDVQSAQERIAAKEQRFQAMEGANTGSGPQTPAGLEAAKQTTLDRAKSATSHRRSSTQGLVSSTELPGSSG